MRNRRRLAIALCCSSIVLACNEAPEGEESTTLFLDEAEAEDMDEVESEESDDGSDGSSSSDDDTADEGTNDTSDTNDSSMTTTTTTDTADDDDTTESTTGGFGMCGWDPRAQFYDCGFEGEDPNGLPIECPQGLVENDPCDVTGLGGEGCCDANGDNWYCAEGNFIFLNACG